MSITFDVILRVLSTSGIITLVGLWWRRDIALRKLASSEAGDLRDSYAAELAAVRAERNLDRENAIKVEKHLRGLIEDGDRRHEECEISRRNMRKEMDEMHEEIAGLKRQVPIASADQLLIMEGAAEHAPHAAASAERVKEIGERNGDK